LGVGFLEDDFYDNKDKYIYSQKRGKSEEGRDF
jgi:hypothetical protein